MITIDGSKGEGGGQVLRSALSLAMITGKGFRMRHIRAKRAKPGLMRQHLTAVLAAKTICAAKVSGAQLKSDQLTFEPGSIRAGTYEVAVGTAGSANLVLQTLLLPLAFANSPSSLTLSGGTHNPLSPPYDFIVQAYLPLLARMGLDVEAKLLRYGFAPSGGGTMAIRVHPGSLRPLTLNQRGRIQAIRAKALLAKLPEDVGRRLFAVLATELSLSESTLVQANAPGRGSALLVEVTSDGLCEVFTAFGQKNVAHMAYQAIDQVQTYLSSDAPVGEYLADQLLLPMALAGGGIFRTAQLSDHFTTNVAVIQKFLDCPITWQEEQTGTYLVTLGEAGT